MAKFGEEDKLEETEYESGSEESVFAPAMRRRNASDDDDDYVNSEGEVRGRIERSNKNARVGYGDESDALDGYNDNEEVSYVDELKSLQTREYLKKKRKMFMEKKNVKTVFMNRKFQRK